MGVVVRRYIDFLILLIPFPPVSVLFFSSIPTFCSFKKNRSLVGVIQQYGARLIHSTLICTGTAQAKLAASH